MKAKKVFTNVGGSLVMQAVNILTNLILPPLLISVYGSQVNGLISTVTQIISYISLVGAGLSTSIIQSLYKPLAENNHNKVSGMINAAGKMFNKVGIIFVTCALITSILYPLLVHSEMSYVYMTILMLVMSISGAMEFFATGRYRSLLYADRKIYVYSLIQSLCLLISTALAVLCVKLRIKCYNNTGNDFFSVCIKSFWVNDICKKTLQISR